MSVRIHRATVDEVFSYSNINEVLNDYADKGKSDLVQAVAKPDIDTYTQLEELNLLDVFVALDKDKLVGLIVSIHNVMPHYTKKCTTVESLYVNPEYRGYGTAKRLVDSAKANAKANGSIIMFMSLPYGDMLGKVANSFGFTPTNVTYSQGLTDE